MHALWALVLLACDSPSEDKGLELDPSTVSLEGECAMDVDFGGFTISSGADAGGVRGSVADGVVPFTVLEPLAHEGACQVLRRNNPVCDPPCEAGQTCDFDGSCIPWPVNQDLGEVRVHGLAQDVVMQPVFPGNTYFDSSLPEPPSRRASSSPSPCPRGSTDQPPCAAWAQSRSRPRQRSGSSSKARS